MADLRRSGRVIKRVVSVVAAPDWGGLHAVIERTTPFIIQGGFARTVVCPAYRPDTVPRLQAAGATVICHYPQRIRRTWNPLVHLRYLARFPSEVLGLAQIFRESQADIVEVAGLLNWQPVVASLLCGKPLVWQLHGTLAPKWIRYPVGLLCSLTATSIMTSGVGMIQRHGGIQWRRSRITPFCAPLNLRQFRKDAGLRQQVRAVWGIPADAVVVGTLAVRGWVKNHPMLVEVARRLKGTAPRLCFALVGNPLVDNQHIYRQTVEEPIRKLGLDKDGYVRVIEQDRPPSEIMNAFDIFALTSVAEGASLVTAEAMAAGLPIIATDVGSLRDIVKPGVNGFLVDVNDFDAMSRSIESLLDDRLRATMGEESRRIVEAEVSDERCAEAHLRAYAQALAVAE